MKFYLFSLVIFSNIAMSAEPFCESTIGKMLTLTFTANPEDREKLEKDKNYREINKSLSKVCVETENKGARPEEIYSILNNECIRQVADKYGMLKYQEASRPCKEASSLAWAYFEGFKEGKAEGKTCDSKTAVNDLSRTVKHIEQEISNSSEAPTKTIGK